MVQMNLYVGRNRVTEVVPKHVDTGDGEGGTHRKISTAICTLPYVKQIARGSPLEGTGSSAQCFVMA